MSGEREHLDTLAEIAYGAYRAMKSDDNAPGFDVQPLRERQAWRAVADAVRTYVPAYVEQRRLTFKHDTAITAIEVEPLGPKGVVPTLHAKAGDVLMSAPDGGEVYVQRGDVRGHEVVAHYVDDGLGVLRPVAS